MNESAPAIVSAAWPRKKRAAAPLAIMAAIGYLPMPGRNGRAEDHEAHILRAAYRAIDDIGATKPSDPPDRMLPAWCSAGGEPDADVAPEPRAYEARPPRRDSACSWRDVHASPHDPNLRIVDARNAARVPGRETDPCPQIRSDRHMSRAVSLPWRNS